MLATIAAAPVEAAAPTTRDAALAAYAQAEADSAVASGWTGDSDSCATGTESQASLDATLRTLNVLRSFVDARPVTLDPELNERALAAAALMAANGALSHSPSEDWTCFSQLGLSGASTSNLYLGRSGAAAMVGYVMDEGVSSLGHRFWVLDSAAVTMGSGSTGSSNALTVIGNERLASTSTALAAWPPAGYVPFPWVPSQWSATLPGTVDLSSATITMTMDGATLPVTAVTSHAGGYGSGSSISWRPTFPDAEITADTTFTVTISGLPAGASSTYTVHAVLPAAAATGDDRELTDATPPSRFVARPRITWRGRLRAGTRLTVLARVTGATRRTYQWERDGRILRGQTRPTYTLLKRDRGHRIRVLVRLTGAGGRAAQRSLDVRPR